MKRYPLHSGRLSCARFSLMLRCVGSAAFLWVALAASSCSHDKEVATEPNPCATAQPNPLTFKMREQVGNQFFETDSTYPRTLSFRAPRTYTTFRWKIGNDPKVFTDSSFTLEFTQAVGTIPIQLIATRALNTTCFPHDDGVDTLTKSLTILPLDPQQPHAAIEGKYLGATLDAPQDTFTVRVYTAPVPYSPQDRGIFLKNLNKGCQGTAMSIVGGYRSIVFNQGNFAGDGCKQVAGVGFLDPLDRNKIRFVYSQIETAGATTRTPKTFVGNRIR